MAKTLDFYPRFDIWLDCLSWLSSKLKTENTSWPILTQCTRQHSLHAVPSVQPSENHCPRWALLMVVELSPAKCAGSHPTENSQRRALVSKKTPLESLNKSKPLNFQKKGCQRSCGGAIWKGPGRGYKKQEMLNPDNFPSFSKESLHFNETQDDVPRARFMQERTQNQQTHTQRKCLGPASKAWQTDAHLHVWS